MRPFLFLLLLCCGTVLFAQKAEEAVKTLFEKYPQEKVVFSLSQKQYIAGESIFFKAYALTGYEPSAISTNLYTELYNSAKTIIDKQIIPLVAGSGEGSFALPASLAEGIYFIRAYTQYSLNFSEALVKAVPVYNTASANRLAPKPAAWRASVVPEGGRLVAGVTAQVIVRLLSPTPLPQHFKAVLVNKATAETVAEAQVFNNEVGSIYFTPDATTDLVVRVTDDSGAVQEVPAPKAATDGTSLSLRPHGNKLTYFIQSRGLPAGLQGYKLMATLYDQVVYSATVKGSAADVTGTVDVSAWPAGAVRFTLFDGKETAVNERLFFVHPATRTLKPAVARDTVSFAAKAQNALRLDVDTGGWASYAVRVLDAASPAEDEFLADLYLRSDFTAPIHNAASYLSDTTEGQTLALDALMASERWQRFAWSNVLAGRFPTLQHPPDRYLGFSGTVSKGRNLLLMKDINLLFRAKDSSVQFVQARTDSSGSFELTNLAFTDTVKVFYQANNRKFFDRDVAIRFEPLNRFAPYNRSLPETDYRLVPRSASDTVPAAVRRAVAQRAAEVLLSEKTRTLKAVVVRTRARSATQELNDKLSSPLFSTPDATVFDFVNDDQISALSYTNVLDWLQGRVPGLTTRNVDGATVPFIRGNVAQVFLDEMPVEPDVLVGLPVSNIAMLKVMRNNFLGSSGGRAAVAVYTRRGGMEGKNTVSSLPSNTLAGYRSPVAYPAPDYEQAGAASVPDQRDVLYWSTWNPPAGKTGKTRVLFYNNDSAKAFRVIVTGFAADGRPVYLNSVVR